MVNKFQALLQRLQPRGLCYLCHGPLLPQTAVICQECSADLPTIEQACPFCAIPSLQGRVCATCLNSNHLAINAAFSLYRYAYPANRLITDLKFHGQLRLAYFFGQCMANKLRGAGADLPRALVPVPLHRSRLAERGFNQSLEIARVVSVELGIPVLPTACKRVQNTRPQYAMPAKQRRKNLQRAFAPSLHHCKNVEHVAIIDDVVTTGTTIKTLADALGQGGVKRIEAWSCCRAD